MASPFVAGAFVVRPCTVADLRRLRATWPSSADVHHRHFAGQRAGTQTLLVAWDGDRAVGSGVIRWQNPELPEISDLYPGLVETAHARLGYTSTGVFARSEYDYVDDDGVEQHAVERNEIMIRELDPGPR